MFMSVRCKMPSMYLHNAYRLFVNNGQRVSGFMMLETKPSTLGMLASILPLRYIPYPVMVFDTSTP